MFKLKCNVQYSYMYIWYKFCCCSYIYCCSIHESIRICTVLHVNLLTVQPCINYPVYPNPCASALWTASVSRFGKWTIGTSICSFFLRMLTSTLLLLLLLTFNILYTIIYIPYIAQNKLIFSIIVLMCIHGSKRIRNALAHKVYCED